MVTAWHTRLCWQSDWDGEEVGHPTVPIVGYYTGDGNMNYYIDTETGDVLEKWRDSDEDNY